ncbi:MAG: hypothetical protein J6W49_04905 [Paludibacteraceae bacterium]|nr:hypothetical protein [Paludibacteraceae bacterium]
MKYTTLAEIIDIKADIHNQEIFADALKKELGEIMARSVNGKVQNGDKHRAKEIDEILKEQAKHIAKQQKQIDAFYRNKSVA